MSFYCFGCGNDMGGIPYTKPCALAEYDGEWLVQRVGKCPECGRPFTVSDRYMSLDTAVDAMKSARQEWISREPYAEKVMHGE